MRASLKFNPEHLSSLPAGGRSLSHRCADRGVKPALGAGSHRTFRRAIDGTRHTISQIGHQASNQNADLHKVTHVDVSNPSFRRTHHGSDGGQKIGNIAQTSAP